MIKSITWCGIIAAGMLAVSSPARAESANEYQVTGPVLELTDTMIAVKKDNDRWELKRDAGTRLDGEVKVGTKVTIMYTMTATRVEAKAEKKK